MTTLVLALLLAQDTGKASVGGIVLNALTNEPLKKVHILLGGAKANYATVSAADGKFQFASVSPDTYRVWAQRAEFLDADDEPLIQAAADQHVKDIVIKLTPQGIIAGRVTDEDGDPVLGASVEVERSVTVGGRKVVLSTESAQMNSEGNFFIGELRTGRYYLRAEGEATRPRSFPDDVVQEVLGSSDPVPVQLSAGAAVRDVVLRLRKLHAYRVRGKVTNPSQGSSLRLNGNNGHEYGAHMNKDEFEFRNVLPGNYIIGVSSMESNWATGSLTRAHLFCHVPVTVTDRDVDGITVELGPGANVEGTIKIEGDGHFKDRPVVRLGYGWWNMEATWKEDGTLQWPNLSPEKQPLTFAPPEGFYLKSIQFDHQPVTDNMLDLTSGGGPLEIVVASNPAAVSGVVRDDAGTPLSNIKVALWSGSAQYTRDSDAAGAVQFNGLAPGDYRIAAWQKVDTDFLQIREFRDLFDAQRISIIEGSQTKVDLRPIPKSTVDAEIAKLL